MTSAIAPASAKVMVRALAISLVFFAVLGALGALFVARRVLKRIDDISTSAHGIMAGDLTRRLPVSGSGDELDRLAEGLNEMLGRIAELMEGLREVSDNIAHDLRTPLTRLRNHAEAALAFGGDAAAYRHALEKTIEESDQLIRIFNALLADRAGRSGRRRRAASASRRRRSGEKRRRALRADRRGRRRRADRPRRGRLMVRGNRELIGQAIANLVDNALKYGAPHKGADGAEAKPESSSPRGGPADPSSLTIADRGPGIAPADRARVLDRFVRLEGSRSRPGSGWAFRSPPRSRACMAEPSTSRTIEPGLRVRLTLPAADDRPQSKAPAELVLNDRCAR